MNMKWPFNSCRDHREKISLLANGALPDGEQTSVRDHLSQCSPCRQYYTEIAGLSREFQQWAKTERPVEVGAAFRARWMRSIQTTDRPAPASFPALLSRCNGWLWPSPVAWGALAAVWVALLSLHWSEPAQRATGDQLAAKPPKHPTINLAQRQSELASLLETLAPPPPPPPQPRPRTQRRVESFTI